MYNPYKFHYFKFQLWDNSWKCYWNPSLQKLQRLILNNYKNVYVSLNRFLYYKEHTSYRHHNKILERLLLIDIDGQNFKNKQECERYFIKILGFLKHHHCHIQEIVMTNDTVGGFQITIKSCCRHKVLYHISENQLFKKIDFKVFDDKRIKRPHFLSWNGNKNCPAIPLFKEGLRDFPQNLGSLPSFENHPQRVLNGRQSGEQIPLSKSKDLNIASSEKEIVIHLSPLFPHPLSKDGFHALGMPQAMRDVPQPLEPVLAGKPSEVAMSQDCIEADDNRVVERQQYPPSEHWQGQEIKSNLPCRFLVRQISSSVYGSPNNYVPVLKFPIKPSLKRLKRLQKAYNLSDIYLFQNHLGFVAVSPKTAQKERLYKIYKKAGCWKSLNELQKFRQNWLPISDIYDLKERKKVESFELLDILYSEADGFYSYPHSLFLKKYLNKNYPNLIGTKPKVFVAEFLG